MNNLKTAQTSPKTLWKLNILYIMFDIQPEDPMKASEMDITYHSLQIHLWIPIRVIYDDNICCGKVNTKTTSSRRQHEDEFLTAWFIEFIDLSLTVLVRCLSIQSTILKKKC